MPGRDVRLRAFDVAKLEGCDLAATEERLDVRLDAAAVHRQRGRLDRSPTAAEDPPGFRLGQIPVADFGDGEQARCLGFLRGTGSTPLETATSFSWATLRASSTVISPYRPMTALRFLPSGVRYWMTKLLRPDGMTCTPNPRFRSPTRNAPEP